MLGDTTGGLQRRRSASLRTYLDGATAYSALVRCRFNVIDGADECFSPTDTSQFSFRVTTTDVPRWNIPSTGGSAVNLNCLSGGAAVTLGQWYSFVCVVDLAAGSASAYIPGTAVSSGAVATASPAVGAVVGAALRQELKANTSETDWDWAEGAVWTGALTAAEIDLLADRIASLVSPSSAVLRGHWYCDTESSGSASGSDVNLSERTGLGNYLAFGTISGTPSYVSDGPAIATTIGTSTRSSRWRSRDKSLVRLRHG